MPRTLIIGIGLIGLSLFPSAGVPARPASHALTFEQRVRAQEAIERVAYSHLEGARRPFEDAVPRPLLERKVRTYLRQSRALEQRWKVPISADSLTAELERIAASSPLSGRLEEIYGALGHDPVLILETFARQSLADRLIRDLFQQDQRVKSVPGKRARRPWEDWWRDVEGSLDDLAVEVVATASTPLPAPACRPSDTWDTYLTSAPGPTPMSGHQAVWTGNEMIIWGGNSQGGARFDPLTGVWRYLPPVEGPDAGVIAVWTGHEMLLWGRIHAEGEDGHAILRIGGVRYDPIADSWHPINPATSVQGWKSSAVWTGREMIVWGGDFTHLEGESDDTALSAAGGRYDPERDVWTPTSMTGAPTPRASHAAVWTGMEMIVWGGYGYEDDVATGGARYDPATDTWRSMSQDGPHVTGRPAVWTGREMILFGAPGAAYDPAADRWRTLSSVVAPFPRDGASATRAGDFVILWGGWDWGRHKTVNTGSLYHPASDTWTPMSGIQAPSPRQDHSAVWTGEALILWGGRIPAPGWTLTATGGIYVVDQDVDGDGLTRCQGDCDDARASVHPGAVEIPGNAIDEDCDGARACDPAAPWRSPGALSRCVAQECARSPLGPEACRGALRTPGPSCGNGARDGKEMCDGDDLGGQDCTDLGFAGGTLDCNATCGGFDVSLCTGLCGNGVRDGHELCDGADLGGSTCVSLGYDGGTLGCHGACLGFDQGLCTSVCGDGVRRGAEACDGGDLGGRTCATMGFDGGTLACSPVCDRLDVSGCTTVCGDGVRRGLEVCDGADMDPAKTCNGFGFHEGALACRASCDGYDTSGCARCGDGVKAGAEACDKTDFGGETCQSLGFEGGTLTCNWNCSEKSIGLCVGCGNHRVEGSELCDGSRSCRDLGYDGGSYACNATCDAIDTSRCTECGDGVKAPTEACEPHDLGGQTCQGLGYDGGSLRCRSDCRNFDASDCTTVCGDGVRKREEVCDGEVEHADCRTYGYDGGTLRCNATCRGFDFTACSRCGDGQREPPEQCEGPGDQAGQTCVSLGLGYVGGTLSCQTNCRFDTSSCVSDCGDGVIAGHEFCDGNDLGGRSCRDFGFDEGTLACRPDCRFVDVSGCSALCGNGVRGFGEICDGADVGRRSCFDEGFQFGALSCNTSCDGYDTSGCTRCGNGVRERPEVCDGGDLGGWTCRLFGYQGGVLACSSTCDFDESQCVGN